MYIQNYGNEVVPFVVGRYHNTSSNYNSTGSRSTATESAPSSSTAELNGAGGFMPMTGITFNCCYVGAGFYLRVEDGWMDVSLL